MWLDEHKKSNNNESNNNNCLLDVSDVDSDSSGEELPIWVRGEQRWVSGVAADTTCQEVIQVLLQDEEGRVSAETKQVCLSNFLHKNIITGKLQRKTLLVFNTAHNYETIKESLSYIR